MRIRKEELEDLMREIEVLTSRVRTEVDIKWKHINKNRELEKQLALKDDRIATLEAGVSVRQRDIEEMGDKIEKLKEGIKWRDGGIKDLEYEIDKKNEEIERLNACKKQFEIVNDNLNRKLTEKELFEKKKKENAPTGVPAIDATVDRLIKLEAKFEAQENPYFF